MAVSTRTSLAAKNAQVDAVTRQLDGGFLRMYTGPRPASADAPIREQTLLAELRFSTPAFEPAEGGKAKARTIIQEASAKESGEAVWYRTFRADGRTAVFDGSVGKTEGDIVMNNPNIQINAIVMMPGFTYEAIGE